MTGLFNSLQSTNQHAKGKKRLSREGAHLTGYVRDLKPIEQRQEETIEYGQRSRSTPFTNLTRIFSQGHISTPMETILNRPVLPYELQEAIWVRLSRSETSEAVDDLLSTQQGFVNPSTQAKNLSNAQQRTGQKVIEFCRSNQHALFQAAMTHIGGLTASLIVAVCGVGRCLDDD